MLTRNVKRLLAGKQTAQIDQSQLSSLRVCYNVRY